MRRLFFVAAALVSAGCANIPYDTVSRGTFSGQATVVWVGGATNAFLGDGEFLYVPMPGQELTFTRMDGTSMPLVIQPEAFYTDGGSIPRLIQGAEGFNAWGFGPAYIIHDWLFWARRCLNDEDTLSDDDADLLTDRMRELEGLSFRDSAVIMAELIKTLAGRPADDSAGAVISNVVAGPISYEMWHAEGECPSQRLKEEHLKVIADLTRQRARRAARSGEETSITSVVPAGELITLDAQTSYTIVGQFNF